MQLRPYQAELIERVVQRFRAGASSVCMQMGTGGGKTASASALIKRAVERDNKVLFLAHLDELIDDTHERLVQAGVPCGVVQAGKRISPLFPVQVASLQTLHVRGERPPANLVILDECHRAMGASVRGILGAYKDAALLGLTATVQRGDGQPLGDVFEHLECGPTNRWLTEQGYLVPCDILAPPTVEERGLSDNPVSAYLRACGDDRRPAIFFASNVAHAKQLRDELEASGVPSALIVGTTAKAERRAVKEALESGAIKAIVGVSVFLEGWDVPCIEVVVLARAFTVTGGFLQAIGRGLRPNPATGKRRCTVLDLRGAVNLHGLPDEDRVWSLTGAAVRRAEIMPALGRCKACFAVFRPSVRCPRCGEVTAGDPKMPRVLNRAEKIANMSHLSQGERDHRYLSTLRRTALVRIGMPEIRATEWALKKFVQRFGRQPECAR